MEILIFVIAVILLALSIACIANKNMTQTIPLTIGLITLVTYVCGLLRILDYSNIIVYILEAGLLIYTFIKYGFKKVLEKLNNSGTYAIIIFAAIFAIVYHGRLMTYWDEFSHWGTSVNNMLETDQHYSRVESATPLKTYTSIIPLLNYFVLNVTSKMNEGVLYAVMAILMLSMMLPFLDSVKNKKVKALATFVFTLLPMIFIQYTYGSRSLYVDALLSIAVVHSIYIWIYNKIEKFSIFNFIVTNAFVSLIKDSAIVFAFSNCLFILIDFLFIRREEYLAYLKVDFKHVLKNKGIYIIVLLFLIIPVVRFSWSLNCDEKYVTAATGGTQTIKQIISGQAPAYKIKVIKNYINYLKDNEFSVSSGLFKFNLTNFYLVVAATLIYIYNKAKDKDAKKYVLQISSWIIIASAIYYVFLLVAYVIAFKKEEALILASIDRYISVIIAGIIILIYGLILKITNKEKTSYQAAIASILLCLCISNTPVSDMYVRFYSERVTSVAKNPDRPKMMEVLSKIEDKTKKIYFVSNSEYAGYQYFVFKYLSAPIQTNEISEFQMLINEEFKQKLIKDLYDNYDYVFIHISDATDERRQMYGNIVDVWQDYCLYKIEKIENNQVKLIKVDKII